jgi:hypothetical protein
VPATWVASAGIEYETASKTTSAVGPTTMGMRSASFSRRTFTRRRRTISSWRRISGITLVVRDGVCSLTVVCHTANCAARSASSWNLRCLKNEPFTQPTRRSTLPFWLPLRGAQISTPTPRSTMV